MALDDIIDAIRLETDAQVEAIEMETEARATAIREEGARAAAVVETELADSRSNEAAQAQDRIRSRARFEVDGDVRRAREEIVQRVLVDVEQRLSEVRASAGYQNVFARLVAEALNALPEATVAHVDPRDATAARDTFSSGVDVVADLDTYGGVVLADPGGRTVYNTIELRLHRAEPHIRQMIAEKVPTVGARPP